MGSAAGPNLVTDNLILYLDAANTNSYSNSGTTWNDLSGNGYDATLTNGPTYNSDNGGYFIFDGTNDHAVIDSSFQVSTSGTYSFEAWIYKTATSVNNAGMLISGGYGGDKDGIIISSEDYAISGTIRVFSLGGTCAAVYYNGVSQTLRGDSIVTNETFNLNEWINIALTGITVNNTDGAAHHIGQNNNDTNEFGGRISNIKLYDRTLTAAEVKQNFNKLRWRFGI